MWSGVRRLILVLGCPLRSSGLLFEHAAAKENPCTNTPSVSRETCLEKPACMWIQETNRNVCTPCQWAGIDIPCAPDGSTIGTRRVVSCSMNCEHQKVLSQVSACTDESGSIDEDDCFSKGSSAKEKCMWTAYDTFDGVSKSMCGPCAIENLGTIPKPAPGAVGPEPQSTVKSVLSQCANDGVDSADMTNVEDVWSEMHSVPLQRLGVQTNADAPQYWAVPVPKPYGPAEFANAAAEANRAAGWPADEIQSLETHPTVPGGELPYGVISVGSQPNVTGKSTFLQTKNSLVQVVQQ